MKIFIGRTGGIIVFMNYRMEQLHKSIMCSRLYTCLLFFLLSVGYGRAQTLSYADSLIISLSENERFFELEDAYNEVGQDLSPFWKLFCKAELEKVFNRSEESSRLLIEFIETYRDNVTPDFKNVLYGMLFDDIIKTGNSHHYQWVYKDFSQYIENNPDSLSAETLAMYKKSLDVVKEEYKKKLAYPSIRIIREHPNQGVPLLQDPNPIIMAKLNDFSYPTMIDTGASDYLLMSNEKASEIGVRYYSKGIRGRNDEKVEFWRGLIDSIQIGTLKLYNIPVHIEDSSPFKNFPDSLKKKKELVEIIKEAQRKYQNPIIGLPLLEKIGKVQFDFNKNTISFPRESDSSNINKHNLLIIEKRLCTQVNIDNVLATFGIDTGADLFATLSNDFYRKNKDLFSIEEMDTTNNDKIVFSISLYGAKEYKPPLYLKNPLICFLDRRINRDNKQKIEVAKKNDFITSVIFFGHDGVLGYPFFRSMKNQTILFDFKNMVITIPTQKTRSNETIKTFYNHSIFE